ncbi:MAG TPA: caspase family protein [Longimicrobium sp.]|nr:caspase family protein [Longimicrobium sp.]
MTLVAGRAKSRLEPATHALVVGVGEYPHLEGGTGPRALDAEGLKQLTSPPVSACAFVDWLHELHNPAAPLGSIELLLSPGDTYVSPDGRRATKVEPATWRNIARAYQRWYARCDGNTNNVAIFYFCGHGLERETLALLPADFGRYKLSAFATAIHFNKTYYAMSSCRARTQCFFIDTCREVSPKLLANTAFGGQSLGEPDLLNQRRRTAPILYATASGYSAFGEERQVSRFTSALLAALQGGGAKKELRRWVISTDRLATSVKLIINKQNETLPPYKQQDAMTGGDFGLPAIIHELADAPTVPTVVDCVPEAANAAAELYLHGRLAQYRRARGTTGPWRQLIKAGAYDAGAIFQADAGFQDLVEDEWVEPPEHQICLEAR